MCHVHRGGKRPVAHLDIHHQTLQAGGQFFGQDAGGDQGHRFDGGGDITDGIQPAVGGCQIVGLSDDGASCGFQGLVQRVDIGRGLIARDAAKFVERAAGMSQTAPGDHRYHATTGSDDGREHQADLVAHATAGVFVQNRAVQVGF